MGFHTNDTKAPGVTNAQRHQLLGNSFDLRAVSTTLALCRAMGALSLAGLEQVTYMTPGYEAPCPVIREHQDVPWTENQLKNTYSIGYQLVKKKVDQFEEWKPGSTLGKVNAAIPWAIRGGDTSDGQRKGIGRGEEPIVQGADPEWTERGRKVARGRVTSRQDGGGGPRRAQSPGPVQRSRSLEPLSKSERDVNDWKIDDKHFELLKSSSPHGFTYELFRAEGNQVQERGHDVHCKDKDGAFSYPWTNEAFYGNPPYEPTFLYRTFEKANQDWLERPTTTSFEFVVPKWKSYRFWELTKEWEQVHEFDSGTWLFTVPTKSTDGKAQRTTGNRSWVGPTRWPVVVMRRSRLQEGEKPPKTKHWFPADDACQQMLEDTVKEAMTGRPGQYYSYATLDVMLANSYLAKEPGANTEIWDEPAMAAVLQGWSKEELLKKYSTAEVDAASARQAEYRMEGGMLLRIMGDGTRRMVPKPEDRKKVVTEAHIACGHFGEKRTKYLVMRLYWWRGMKKDVHMVVSSCVDCARTRNTFTAVNPTLHPLPIKGLCYRWSLDLCKLPMSYSGYRYVMVAVEHLSRFVMLIPLANKSPASTAFCFRYHILAIFGMCAEVITDNGGEFMGEFQTLMEELMIDHRWTSVNHAQANGLAERMVQTTKRACQRISNRESSTRYTWEQRLPFIALALNASPQTSTGLAPSTVMFAQAPSRNHVQRLEEPLNFDLDRGKLATVAELLERAQLIQNLGICATENLAIAQHRDRLRYAMTHNGQYVAKTLKFHVGMFVYLLRGKRNLFTLPTRHTIVKLVEMRDNGVVILEGRDTRRFSRHVTNIVPCHLTNIDSYQNSDEVNEDIACTICGDRGHEAVMILCDGCEKGFHIYCMTPKLTEIPAGDWYCKDCEAEDDED